MNRFGFTVSNEECIEWETSMENKILNEMGENNGNFIPYGIKKDALPFYHLDNSDFAEDSDITTHAFLLTGFQNCSESGNESIETSTFDPIGRSRQLLPCYFRVPRQTSKILYVLKAARFLSPSKLNHKITLIQNNG